MKLDMIIEQNKKQLDLLQQIASGKRSAEARRLEEPVSSPVDTVQELQELCEKMSDAQVTDNIVRTRHQYSILPPLYPFLA